MEHGNPLAEIVLLLATAVCIVAFFRRLNLSPVLGYLAAGAAIGPHGLALVQEVQTTHAVAELGVVFLLFVIGLELSFERLARMRGKLFAFGLMQVPLTSLCIGGVAYWLGQPPEAALIIGGGLALSSTAIVLELIGESNEKVTQTGRLALATLLIQDLAVIPLLVLVPLLGTEGSLTSALGEAGVKAVIGLIALVLLGRLLLKPLFGSISAVAGGAHHELFTAATLLVVLGLAYVSTLAGLSAALGAFMGGLLVAETEFRHQVEADIMPFKGLLLGFFFITVGMSIHLPLLLAEAPRVLMVLAGLIALKALAMLLIGLALALPLGKILSASLLLAQGGEFAFVLFSLASAQGILSEPANQLLVSAVALSMALTPLLQIAGRRLGQWADRKNARQRHLPMRETVELHDHVIIAGFGRVGRIIAQLMEAERIPYVALDLDAANVGAMRELGKHAYYGDAGRPIVLKAVGLARAQAVIITHGDARTSLQTIAIIRSMDDAIPIIARAKDIDEVLQLEGAGAKLAVAEMFETSLQMGGALLKEVGVADTEVSRMLDIFRAEDYALARQAEPEAPAPKAKADFSI